MISWRVTKYNPKHRNEEDVYLNDEWTSCHDIGKLFDGKVFTVNDYLAIENAYIEVVLSFMKNVNITTLKVKCLEKYNESVAPKDTSLGYTTEMIKLYVELHEDSILGTEDIQNLCRLVLREQLWCKLENDHKMFVHFGYDYYMYIGCLLKPENITDLIKGTGLFMERIESPYYEV